ncbi:MAG: 2OG-Fe(II) oxygenase, partial [Gemmatimonadota bacterium]
MVPPSPVEALRLLLTDSAGGADFAASLTLPPEALHVEVEGVGPLALPITAKHARDLVAVARPARYGKGEETLLDPAVRDTWEIPPERVRFPDDAWTHALDEALESLGRSLGLGEGTRLVPELHALLIYGPGQFFLPHRDSEKSDEMVATLTVTLPSRFTGGEFVVEHGGQSRTFRGSQDKLSLVAFYADCQHEARPVKSGFRIVLTYNLSLAGTEREAPGGAPQLEELAAALHTHFHTPRPPRWAGLNDTEERDPPDRFAFLLDHQYSLSGLAWHRLKGEDRMRADLLRAAADRADCEIVLALAEIQETWECYEEEPEWGYGRRGRRSWTREEDEWVEDGPEPPEGPDRYELGALHDSSIAVKHWIEPDGAAEPVYTLLAEEETCATTPTSHLQPYASEYEGNMGNWGNTMDRWYQRAAVVLWPRERRFAVRTDASPRWTVDTMLRLLKRGRLDEVRTMARDALPVWRGAIIAERGRKLFGRVLRIAEGIEDAELAAELLAPLQLEAMRPRHAGAFAALVAGYEEPWADAFLSRWSESGRRGVPAGQTHPLDWISALPELIDALMSAVPGFGWSASSLLLRDRWEWLAEEVRRTGEIKRASRREEEVLRLAEPLLGLLAGAELAEEHEVRDEAVAFLCADEREHLLPCLLEMLRSAAAGQDQEAEPTVALQRLRARSRTWLEQRLARPARAEDDWSLPLPEGCACELCRRLKQFLGSRDERHLEWPIAKARRQHVHQRIDGAELPVDHRTRR